MTCSHFLFTLLPLFCMLSVVKSINFKGSFDTTGGTFLFANPVPFHRHQLNSAPIESQEVEDEEGCVFACAKATQCKSVNFKTVAEANGKFICHILDADKFVFPELFNRSVEFHHYSFTAPCEHNPCLNGGTCYPVNGQYDFRCACLPGLQGKRCNVSLQSCAELLNAGFNESGIYQIRPNQSEIFSVYCDQTSRGGGWTMVFKVVSGVSADIYQLWSSSESLNEDKTEALNVNSSFRGHYKNRLVPNWQNPKEVRVALYKTQNELFSIVFDAANSDSGNWFSKDRVISSPSWTDFSSYPPTYFSVAGSGGRAFYIAGQHSTCQADHGWLMTTSVHCGYELRLPTPSVIYSKLQTNTNWNTYENVGIADVLLVYIR